MSDDLVKRGSVIAVVNLFSEVARLSRMSGHETIALVASEIVKLIKVVPASDELTTLTAERDALKEELRAVKEAYDDIEQYARRHCAEVESLTAERDALIRDRDRWAAEAQVSTSPTVAGLMADNARLREVLALVMEAAAKFSEEPVMADNMALLKAVSNMRVVAGKARAALTGEETK